jgi:hypothetical protein
LILIALNPRLQLAQVAVDFVYCLLIFLLLQQQLGSNCCSIVFFGIAGRLRLRAGDLRRCDNDRQNGGEGRPHVGKRLSHARRFRHQRVALRRLYHNGRGGQFNCYPWEAERRVSGNSGEDRQQPHISYSILQRRYSESKQIRCGTKAASTTAGGRVVVLVANPMMEHPMGDPNDAVADLVDRYYATVNFAAPQEFAAAS